MGVSMNYMEQVAQMLGVELGEEFNLEGNKYKYKITEDGMKRYWELGDDCEPANYTLLETLFGKYEIKKPILDQAEKEYLCGIIKPFRDRIEYIIKNSAYSPIEFITIKYKDGGATNLPLFEKDTMYKGMEPNKKYTLEELGL